MSAPFTVRLADIADYERVVAVLAEVDALHQRELPWMFRTPETEPRSRELVAGLVTNPDSRLLVAEAGASIVGVATVFMRGPSDFGVFVAQRFAVLDTIAVVAAWQRRGVGTALFRAAERWAQSSGANWIEVGVFEFNTGARTFYESLGYFALSTKLRKPLPPA